MKENEHFEEVIKTFSREIQEIARQTRHLIYEVLPEVVEVVWVQQKNIGFGTKPKIIDAFFR